MGGWLRTLVVVLVVLAVGALIGSAISQRGWTSGGAGDGKGGAPQSKRVRVEVLNAGGVRGAARAATEVLRDRGFDVVLFGNAGTFDQDSSVVYARVPGVDDARAVADALGIRNVRSEPDANLYLDVSVWLGADWVPERQDSAGNPPTSPAAWWDLRRFFSRP